MKMNVLSKIMLTAAIFSRSALGRSYGNVMVDNQTDCVAHISVMYAVCNHDEAVLQPKENTDFSRGACLVKQIAGYLTSPSGVTLPLNQFLHSGTDESDFYIIDRSTYWPVTGFDSHARIKDPNFLVVPKP